MSKFPSLPLFVDAWVAKTKHLSRLERGTYHDLLVLMWCSPGCRVPNDDIWLGKHLGMTVEEVRKELWPIIAEFCQNSGNFITQKRLRKERGFVEKISKQRSASAKLRWNKEKDVCTSNTLAYPSRNAPTPTLTYLERKKEEDTAGAVPSASKYEFESGIIRLTKRDFEKWQKAFAQLDLAAELIGLSEWATKEGPDRWFHAVSGALAKRNREAKQAVSTAKAQPETKRPTADELYWGRKTPGID